MNVLITILVDGKALVGFKWPVVPRLGELILVGVNPEARKKYLVIDVVYHGETDPRIELHCTEATA